ncbi:MAG: alpha/beta fold hydrolase [Euryarchaeota archaeon]|jgi:pimeloyl-ACP methyl ester carboxylesterase|nr:alpha/beta fold hydrolase [Euryarchaeota archaeon]MBT5736898.1 alpha/beta fold hydrolase [Euryarchaeota archaeon]
MKSQFPASKGAAAYSKSLQWKMSWPWTIFWALIAIELILWHQESQILINILFWTISITIALNAIYLGFEAKVLAAFFRPYPKDAGEVTNPNWRLVEFTGWGGDEPMGYFIPAKGISKGLILYIHGYSSSMARAENRITHLSNQGFDVAGIDMRGHGRCSLNKDWTLLKVAADIEAFLDTIICEYKELPRVHFYGHSMGGFLTLRLSSHKSGWWKDQLDSIILESAVSSIPEIIKLRVGSMWNLGRPLIRLIIRTEMKRIHPDLTITFWNAKIPQIGLPGIPVLTLQSKNDSALGRTHYNLIKKHIPDDGENQFHLISDLEHTTTLDSMTRREILEKWLIKRS